MTLRLLLLAGAMFPALTSAHAVPASPAAPAAPTAGPGAPTTAEVEARAFMAAYEADLRRKDAAAVAARYHPDGAYMIFDGQGGFESFAAIGRSYADGWRGPEAFAWRDLTFEPVGADAVLVNGGFEWTAAGKAPRPTSYTALLKRHAGQWRIRMENETPIRK